MYVPYVVLIEISASPLLRLQIKASPTQHMNPTSLIERNSLKFYLWSLPDVSFTIQQCDIRYQIKYDR